MSKYTTEQKDQAVRLALQASSITVAANKLNIPTSTLQDWVRDHRIRSASNPNFNHTEVNQKLIKKDKEIKKLKEEIEILKKFEAFSAKTLR